MPSILFVCTANQFRSPLAAACLLKTMEHEDTGRAWIVESAGTWAKAGLPAPDIALQVASQLGLEGLEGHRTRQVDHDLLDQFDLILVMESGHKEALCSEFPSVGRRVHLLPEIADGIPYDIPDPADARIEPNEVGRELNMLIARGKEKILQLAERLRKYSSPE